MSQTGELPTDLPAEPPKEPEVQPTPVPPPMPGTLDAEQQRRAEAWVRGHWTLVVCPFHGPTGLRWGERSLHVHPTETHRRRGRSDARRDPRTRRPKPRR